MVRSMLLKLACSSLKMEITKAFWFVLVGLQLSLSQFVSTQEADGCSSTMCYVPEQIAAGIFPQPTDEQEVVTEARCIAACSKSILSEVSQLDCPPFYS